MTKKLPFMIAGVSLAYMTLNGGAILSWIKYYIPYGIEIYMEFNLATWLRLVKFMEL